jgi:hypothetical protein
MSIFFSKPLIGSDATFAGGVADAGDIFSAAWDAFALADNFRSAEEALDRTYQARNAEILELTGQTLPNPMRSAPVLASVIPSPFDPFARSRQRQAQADARAEWDRQAGALAKQYPAQAAIGNFTRPIDEDAAALTRDAQGRLEQLAGSRDGAGKWLAVLAGSAGASLTDPVQIATLFAGGVIGGTGKAVTLAGKLAHVAVREALINGASEAVLQPTVQDWRAKAGLPAGFDEGVRNVLFAAGLGGALGAAGTAAGQAVRRLTGTDLTAAAETLKGDPAAPETLRRMLDGDRAALSEATVPVRAALPDDARGALNRLDGEELTAQARPEAIAPGVHEAATLRAARTIDGAADPASYRMPVDAARVQRLADTLAPPVKPAKGGKPQTLIDWLIANGGLQDSGGELAARDAAGLARAFKGRLNRPDGATLDMAGLYAHEAGFFGRRATPDELLAAIDDELGGRPRYRPDDAAKAQQMADDMRHAEDSRRFVEDTLDAILAVAPPNADDALVLDAFSRASAGTDPEDALVEALMARPEADTPAAPRMALPGWDDDVLDAASASRAADPFADGLDDAAAPPAALADEWAISDAERTEFGDFELVDEDGRTMTFAELADELDEQDRMAELVEACRLGLF